MTIQQLFYAIVISEAGSFSKASEILYVSQPSLTEAVHELENETGIHIFTRSSRGVTVTPDGREFLQYARAVTGPYDELMERYGGGEPVKKKFSVSTQHYSFAVKAFVEMVKKFDTREYEFSLMEERTREVIADVAAARSEIGILYRSEFNSSAINKLLRTNGLTFHHLIDCGAFVYLYKDHPLAKRKFITFDMLEDYPCLAFDQGDTGSFYYAEEILSTNDYPRMIKANDRATMLNLMVGLNGYTICSGIICEELNGSDYFAVPFRGDEKNPSAVMEIGYIMRNNAAPGHIALQYIEELKHYLEQL